MTINGVTLDNFIGVNNTNNNQASINVPTEQKQSDFSDSPINLSISSEAQKASQKANQSKTSDKSQDTNGSKDTLSSGEKLQIQKLQARDLHVKMHEQAHLAAAGSYVKGGPTYQYQVGPDHHSYTVGGEVQLNMSPISNNPQATIIKEETIRRAALAPSDPSGADMAVAAEASQLEAQAQMEQTEEASGQNSQANTLNSKANTNNQTNNNDFGSILTNLYHSFKNQSSLGGLFDQVA